MPNKPPEEQSSLLSLPFELRRKIYIYCLSEITLHLARHLRPPNTLGITLTCRQIHTEALDILYAHIPLRISVTAPDTNRATTTIRPVSPPQSLLERFDNVHLVATQTHTPLSAYNFDYIIGKLVAPVRVHGESVRRKRTKCVLSFHLGAHTHGRGKQKAIDRIKYFRGDFERVVVEFEGDARKTDERLVQGGARGQRAIVIRDAALRLYQGRLESRGLAVVDEMAGELEGVFGPAVLHDIPGSGALYSRRITFRP